MKICGLDLHQTCQWEQAFKEEDQNGIHDKPVTCSEGAKVPFGVKSHILQMRYKPELDFSLAHSNFFNIIKWKYKQYSYIPINGIWYQYSLALSGRTYLCNIY